MARRRKTDPPKIHERHPVKASDDKELVRKVVRRYQTDVEADRHNIEPAREDMNFTLGDQWNPWVKAQREMFNKPVLTVNRLPAFIGQYIGAWLQNDTTIKLLPSRGGTKKVAEIRQGLLRSITRTTEAKGALHKAMESAYICGVGNFEVSLRDAKNDVFLRDICLEKLDDPFCVVWDRASKDPTGADANHVFVMDYMDKEDFEKTYPNAGSDSGWVSDEGDATAMTAHGWEMDDMVRVCKFWQMREEKVVLGLEAETGDVIDLTDIAEEDRIAMVAADNRGNPMIRETVRPYAECHVMTAHQVLEGPYRLDIPRVPVFRVEGWSQQQGQVRFRWGFVRHAKDPQRLHNYWRSVLAEELNRSVSTKWLFDTAGQGGQYADQFREAHRSNDPILKWNSEQGGHPPQQFPPPPPNQALLSEAGMTVQDIRDVTNKHEASMGIQSNEVSGKAINARQRVSEMGDAVYTDNMNAALAEAGRVINELIPQVYDTYRTIRIVGEDDKDILQEINGAAGDATPDITVGKYDLTYTTGPSYATKRQEAVDVIMTLMNTMPQVGNVVADIIVRNLDIPGADEIEQRLASLLPNGMIDPENLPARRREDVMKQQQAAQQRQQMQEKLQVEQAKRDIAKTQAEAQEFMARAMRQQAQAKKEMSEVGVGAFEAQTDRIEAEIEASKAGTDIAKTGLDAFRSGLEAATRDTDRDENRREREEQAQQRSDDNAQGS